MTPDAALAELEQLGDPTRATGMAAYHKVPRRYLGVPNPVLGMHARTWRQTLTLDDRVDLARHLWRSDIHEGRIAVRKLLTHARIRPDTAVRDLVCAWVPDFDARAVADLACMADPRRVGADPTRLDQVEMWTRSGQFWSRRAARLITLPRASMRYPKPFYLDVRDRVLGCAATCADDPNRSLQKAAAWCVRDFSRHDPARMRGFLAANGARRKPFARRAAARHLASRHLA